MKKNDSSSQDILKSTGLIGGSKLITVFVSVAQTKIVAILLGPVGIGLVSLFHSVITMIGSLTGFGIGFSAVRDVSQAVASEEPIKVSRTIIILRRWVWVSGALGIMLVSIFSKPLSEYTFGDDSRALDLILLSSSILFAAVSGGQMAILRGYRKIGILAKINIYGSFLGLIITVPLYYFFGIKGVVPVLILTSLSNLVLSWWFSSRIKIFKVKISLAETFEDGLDMVKLGSFKVLTGFIAAGTIYLVKIIIAERSGIDSVGFYAIGTTLSITYMGVLLDAMGTDYFPRLSAVSNNNQELNRLVNEQTLITLLLGTPLVIGMYTFIQLIIILFYSSKFFGAIPLVQWMLLGVYIRLISWPKGYVFLAKAKGKIFVISQSVWNGVYLLIILIGWTYFPFEVVGIAFSIAYLVGYTINIILLKRVTSFKYNGKLLKLLIYMTILISISFSSSQFFDNVYVKNSINAAVFIFSLFLSLKELNQLVAFRNLLPNFLKDKI